MTTKKNGSAWHGVIELFIVAGVWPNFSFVSWERVVGTGDWPNYTRSST
jgi:hypothetical protein